MSFKVHDGVVKWFLREYSRPAIRGHEEISLLQIKNADEEIFVRLAAMTRTGLNLAPGGAFPLDGLVPEVLRDPRVTKLMDVLQSTNPAAKSLAAETNSAGRQTKAEKRMASELAALKAENKRLRTASSGSRGKGKGKDKGNKSNKGGGRYREP